MKAEEEEETVVDTDLVKCPYCGEEVERAYIFTCPTCQREGCPECIPGGSGCECPECETGEEDTD